MKVHLPVVAAMLVASANVGAQSGWEARVTAVPNPLPAGKCAAIVVEPVDDHGYRRTTLSNGAQIDRRQFTYEVSDKTHFVVHNDPAMWGSVCADAGAPSASTIATVTLPDGLQGTVQIFVIAKGAPPTSAVVYRKQAPLRLPTSPEYAPGFVAGRSVATNPADPTSAVGTSGEAALTSAGGATGASGAVAPSSANSGAATSGLNQTGMPLHPRATSTVVTTSTLSLTGTLHVPPAMTITTGTLSLTGTLHVPAEVIVTTATLSLTGTLHVPAQVIVTTATLSLTGTFASQPAPVKSPVVTSQKPVSTKQPHTP
ncbi:MAG: hypothetical protein M3Y30_00790 [Gemmatimonadota bacterium]|nr:hypothetical protein [Gemmatimonadota bacterium]